MRIFINAHAKRNAGPEPTPRRFHESVGLFQRSPPHAARRNLGGEMYHRGDIVEIDGQLAVVVGTAADGAAPAGHIAVWFGDPKTTRGGKSGGTPEVWTVPVEYFTKAKKAVVLH